MSRKPKQPTTKTIRCAIYTRISCEEGHDLEFNSLDAQRESGEAYIASQQHKRLHLPAAALRRRRFLRRQHGASGTQSAAGGHRSREN
jgi:hypothetical protein